MFPALVEGEWEPIKIRTKITPVTNGTNSAEDKTTSTTVDVEMGDAQPNNDESATLEQPPIPAPEPTALPADAEPTSTATTTEETYEDDPFSVEGAVYPMKEGRIDDWPCFFALLSHIYKFISPPFHMPVLIIAQPCWTSRDKEWITQYFFENWKIPALCVMDSALAAAYAYGVQSCCVVDIGLDKADVTAVTEFVVNEIGRGVAIEGCGGNAMTKRLQEEMNKTGKYGEITWEIAEQLKRSPVCEILPSGVPMPTEKGVEVTAVPNPAAAASTGAVDSGFGAREIDGSRPGETPRGPGVGTDVGDERFDHENEEGVLDVAAIVARDNAAELLAKREREKAEKAAAKKGGQVDASRQARLRNSEKVTTTFPFEEYLSPEAANGGNRKRKREIEVGIERFMSATPASGESDGVLDRVAAAVHSTIMAVPDVPARAAIWENMIVLGNGSRVRGFTNALLTTLGARYTLSPSTATIFTSELPSNFTTPVPTNGTNTPIPGQHSMHHSSHGGVNPLLVAATKNMMQPGGSNPHLQVPGQTGSATPVPGVDPNFHHSYRGFTQTPTSMKAVKAPEYFPEWKDPSVSGMEDAAFLGAQVAAKVVFIVDQGVTKGFLTRTEYNDLGPEGIHGCAL